MITNNLRITGMATGLDTDEMIKQLMKVENTKVDKLKQDIQLMEWKRSSYREITNMFRSFKDTYFDVLKPTTNFLSDSAFASFTTTSSAPDVLTATALSGAVSGTQTINVTSLATKATKSGTEGVSKNYTGLTGANAVDMSKMLQGKQFTITLDGVAKTITLDQDYSGFTASNFAIELDRLVDNSFGPGKINVTESAGKLTFAPSLSSSVLSIGDATNTYLSVLGFSNGQSNFITSGSILDFSGGQFNIQVDSGTITPISVATTGTSRNELVANINSALSGAGVSGIVQAIEDPESADKIKFIDLDTTKTITFTAGETDNLLEKVGIASEKSIAPLSGTVNYSVSDIGKDFIIKVDSNSYSIDLTSDYTDDASLQDAIRTQLQAYTTPPFPADVSVNVSGGKIGITTTGTHEITMVKGDDGLRDELGFTSTDSSSRISLTQSLESLVSSQALATYQTLQPYDASGNVEIKVNGITITATKEESINDIINKINASSAGVQMRYESLTDKFILESKSTGSASIVEVEDVKGQFFDALKITPNPGNPVRGTDVTLSIDKTNDGVDNGTIVTRSTNTFTIDGITYDIKTTGSSTLTVSANPDGLLEKFTGFVNKYNELIDKINTDLSEKIYRSYRPLTDDQKKEMSEKDIELWEEKAKSGLLRSDPILQKAVDSMRRALFDPIEGVDISLFDIGISTSNNYLDKGKLVIDETKLKQAIEDSPDKIQLLFTKESQYSYDDSVNRTNRYNEEGLANRIYDIIQDNIRVTRDISGRKGALLEKAGIEGDITDIDNFINDQIKQQDKRLDSLIDKLIDKENYYYNMFARMESAIQQMNAQSAWLSQQFSGQ